MPHSHPRIVQPHVGQDKLRAPKEPHPNEKQETENRKPEMGQWGWAVELPRF
jgi:hypothetical protein